MSNTLNADRLPHEDESAQVVVVGLEDNRRFNEASLGVQSMILS